MSDNHVIIVTTKRLKKHIYRNPKAINSYEAAAEPSSFSNSLLEHEDKVLENEILPEAVNEVLENEVILENLDASDHPDNPQTLPDSSSCKTQKRKAEKLARKAKKTEKKLERKAAALAKKEARKSEAAKKQKSIEVKSEPKGTSQAENKQNIKNKFNKSGKTRKIRLFEVVPTQETIEDIIKKQINRDNYYDVILPPQGSENAKRTKRQRDKKQIAILAGLVVAAIVSLATLIVMIGGIF